METAVPTLSDEEIETANPVPGGIVEETAAPTPSVEASAKQAEAIELVENQFADFAEIRYGGYTSVKPDRADVIEGLHEFCESEKPIDVSDSKEFNENLEMSAETKCEQLELK